MDEMFDPAGESLREHFVRGFGFVFDGDRFFFRFHGSSFKT